MKFRKKPVTIEARQWHMPKQDPKLTEKRPDKLGVYQAAPYSWTGWGTFYIDTLEGRHKVHDKDWIVTGIKGERYPVKPDIFRLTYKRVKDDKDV